MGQRFLFDLLKESLLNNIEQKLSSSNDKCLNTNSNKTFLFRLRFNLRESNLRLLSICLTKRTLLSFSNDWMEVETGLLWFDSAIKFISYQTCVKLSIAINYKLSIDRLVIIFEFPKRARFYVNNFSMKTFQNV